jgi:adenosylcobinamide kinase / adenosylcobinamide-phosphate guanylyltransferase
MNTHIQLILGGARSGKSHYALNQGNEGSFEPKIFLATASAQDEEMAQRIKSHKGERGSQWRTVEEPYDLARALETCAQSSKGLVVVDCATLWISNLLCGVGGKALTVPEIESLFEEFFQAFPRLNGNLRLVSNEVGMGIVPENPLGRQFRDLQGRFNRKAASLADQVILLVAGLPQKMK